MSQPRSTAELVQMVRSFQESRVLLTAVELDIFRHVGEGATAAEVATRCNTDPRATEMLLNGLVALGALDKEQSMFRCTDGSRPLIQDRAGWMHIVHLWDTWSTLTDSVKSGTSSLRPGVEAHQSEWTEAFIAAMHWRAKEAAASLLKLIDASQVRRMLDVGGGSGAFSIAFAQAHPRLHADILDLGPVTAIAQRHIQEAELQDRVQVRVGDMREGELGEGYDLVLLSAVCHMFGEAENKDLLRRCARALAPGGKVVISEFILDPDRTGPPRAALFALNMLVGTKNGNTYTEAEYRQWMLDAGFKETARPDPKGDVILGVK